MTYPPMDKPGPPPGPPPGPAGDTFYAAVMGQEWGPLSYPDLQTMVRTGQVRAETQVRTAMSTWFPVNQVPGLFSDKEWLTTVIISFFIGGLGIDRFWLGYTGLGILKLVTCGGFGVWALVDFILILLRKVPDAQGRPLR